MKVLLDKVSKRFNQDWLFKDLNYQFNTARSYAITGPNGSGKTTLLKVISGMIPSNQGTVSYFVDDKLIDPDLIYQYISYVAPYLEILEDLTLKEFFSFHFSLKPKVDDLSVEQLADYAGLKQALNKPIHSFSSGMKQRAKLTLGLYSAAPVLLLDEPTSNMDESGIAWYSREIRRIKSGKLLIISSNQGSEFEFCDERIELKP